MNTNDALQRSLAGARFEVLPLRGAAERVEHLPAGTTVTVTSSPAKGMTATLELAERLRGAGYHAVPHLAARSILDPAHLKDLLDRMADTGLSEAFVIAGDSPTPAGEFTDSLGLLRAMAELGRRPARIGVGGYPERHAFIPDADVTAALAAKAAHADYLVSQICFDSVVTASWVQDLRARGIELPIHLGIPGVVDGTKLMRISMKIGIGESLRFLRKQHGMVGKLLTRYTPEGLCRELAPVVADPAYGIAGWHFFTFNEIARTRRFRDELSVRLQEVPA
ncbi:methylenetetrahydrofolate reductase [Amycolatopsis cihanbeyliensis]|uniref:Methylenetetrahydrofolate reductase n=1 Tax=Amycolatopsis cihanbeyliensis TaxID=1128664 RepID=A0A542DE89_AMYCI|nr:methylenetetrahydrofolate reductase [Amycolatopsis cihanbeyliensis]TQJ01397.1 methylenetetrahydrofolate reductase (NADPH) [Amycolatopsis cihanbeyliensis]